MMIAEFPITIQLQSCIGRERSCSLLKQKKHMSLLRTNEKVWYSGTIWTHFAPTLFFTLHTSRNQPKKWTYEKYHFHDLSKHVSLQFLKVHLRGSSHWGGQMINSECGPLIRESRILRKQVGVTKWRGQKLKKELCTTNSPRHQSGLKRITNETWSVPLHLHL